MVENAYTKKGSKEYDNLRFTSNQGKLFHALEMEQLRRVSNTLTVPSKILEIGCGTGRFVEYLSVLGHSVWGLDPSPHMLSFAKKKTKRSKTVQYQLGEGAYLPYSNDQFDFVYSIRTINKANSREYAFNMIREMIRVTRPGRLLMIEFVNSWRPHRKRDKNVRISVRDVNKIVKENGNLRMLFSSGVLFFSQKVLEIVPTGLLSFFGQSDRFCCRLLPQLAGRCYVTIVKEE